MKRWVLCMAFALLSFVASAQVNVALLHQLVDHNKSEHTRQIDARNNQAVTTANEAVNRSQLEKLKLKYRELKNRFYAVGLAIDAAQISLEAAPIVSEIIRQQEIIYSLARDNPILIAVALQTEIDLVDRAGLLGGYIAGLALSIGDLNQMKSSDRKILFSHALSLLRELEGTSRGLARSMAAMNYHKKGDPFSDFVAKDKKLVEDIIQKVKVLKSN